MSVRPVGADAIDSIGYYSYHYVKDMNLVYLPFQEWAGRRAVYGVTGANGLANIVRVDETSTNIATGAVNQVCSLDGLPALGRVYISYYLSP